MASHTISLKILAHPVWDMSWLTRVSVIVARNAMLSYLEEWGGGGGGGGGEEEYHSKR